MNRRYNTKEYLTGCELLRRAFKNPAITTDIIVGFPGETDAEFETTREYLKKLQFYEMHVFKYSVRNGTRAADMPDQIPEPVKTKRSGELLALEREMSLSYRESHLGSQTEVLMEEEYEIDGKRYVIGHTKEYIKAAVPFEEGIKGRMIKGTLWKMLTDEIIFLKC